MKEPTISVNLEDAVIHELDFLKEVHSLKEHLTNPDVIKVAIYR